MASRQGQTAQSNLMITFYERKFLERVKEELRALQFAEGKSIPLYSGQTVQYRRYTPLGAVANALAETTLTDGKQDFSVEYIDATVQEFGAYEQFNKMLSKTSIDPELSELTKLNADQAALSLDFHLLREVGFWGNNPVLADTSDYSYEFTASGGATTYITCSSTTDHASTSISTGSMAVCYGGTNYGWAGRIKTGATTGQKNLQIEPTAKAAFDTTSKIRIVDQTRATGSGDKISATNLRKAVKYLKKNLAPKYPNSFYHALIGYDVAADLQADSVWQNAKIYSDVADLYKGYLGSLYGIHFYETSRDLKEHSFEGLSIVPSNYSSIDMDTGGICHTMIFGRNTLADIKLGGMNVKMPYNPPEKVDTANPLGRGGSIGWYAIHAPKSINGAWCADLITTASGLTIATS